MQTVSYSTLISELNALTGIDSFSSTEKSWLNSLINRRIRNAYEMSPFWPRYTVEELRYAGFDNVIPADQNGKSSIDLPHSVWSQNPRNKARMATRHKSVATSDGWKLLGLEDGDYLDIAYTYDAQDKSSTNIPVDSTSAKSISFWARINNYTTGNFESFSSIILNSEYALNQAGDSPGRITFSSSAGTATDKLFLVNSWYNSANGNSPTWDGATLNVFVDGKFIGTMAGISLGGVNLEGFADDEWHHYVISYETTDTTALQFFRSFQFQSSRTASGTVVSTVDMADARVYADTWDASEVAAFYNNPEAMYKTILYASSLPEYWVSYKKQLTSTFGDNTPVPMEFKEYAVHGAYADWLRAEGQTDKATVEEAFANECIMRQLNKISYTNGSDKLWQSISTHSSTQSR